MIQFLPYIQVFLAVILVTMILFQRSEASLGAAFSGGDAANARFSRRGFEKTLFNGTIFVAILFVLSAFLPLLLY